MGRRSCPSASDPSSLPPARDMGVSITPIREALVGLEADGLVAKIPHRGYTVRPEISIAEMTDLFEFRSVVEPWTAERAATLRTDAELQSLVACHRALERESRELQADAYRQVVVLDHTFHRKILDIAGNGTIIDAYVRANTHAHAFRRAFSIDHVPAMLEEHSAILEAIASSDADRAYAAMQQHDRRARERVIDRVGN